MTTEQEHYYDSRVKYMYILGPRTYAKAIPYVKPNKPKMLKKAHAMIFIIRL